MGAMVMLDCHTEESLHAAAVAGGKAAAWKREAARIESAMMLGCEDDTNPELSAKWDATIRRYFG